MKLTREQVLNFPAEVYVSVYALQDKIEKTYGCIISGETACKIIVDWRQKSNQPSQRNQMGNLHPPKSMF